MVAVDDAREGEKNVDFTNVACHGLDDEIDRGFVGDIDLVVHYHGIGEVLTQLLHSIIGVDGVQEGELGQAVF